MSSTKLPADDYMKQSVGTLMYMYYSFCDTFHVRPKDMLDIVDGLLYIEAKDYYIEELRDKYRREREHRR